MFTSCMAARPQLSASSTRYWTGWIVKGLLSSSPANNWKFCRLHPLLSCTSCHYSYVVQQVHICSLRSIYVIQKLRIKAFLPVRGWKLYRKPFSPVCLVHLSLISLTACPVVYRRTPRDATWRPTRFPWERRSSTRVPGNRRMWRLRRRWSSQVIIPPTTLYCPLISWWVNQQQPQKNQFSSCC